MKKSDIAIYVSAILTLVLTTFVVFSTQKVTYENKADDILKNNNISTNQLAMATDPDTTTDATSPLFRNRLSDDKGDLDRSVKDKDDEKAVKTDIRDIDDDEAAAPRKSDRGERDNMKKTDRAGTKKIADDSDDRSFADTRTVARGTQGDSPRQTKKDEYFDDDAPTAPASRGWSSDKDGRARLRTERAEPKTVATRGSNRAQVADINDTDDLVPAKTVRSRTQDMPARTAPVVDRDDSDKSSGGRTHVIQSGEMLRSIAAQYGTTTAKLIQLNSLSNPDLIHPGQKLRLP